MDPNTKRYNDLVSAYKKAYPDLKTALQLQKAQILWNDIKNDSKKYEVMLVDVQKKIQCRQSKQLSFWSNFQSKPVEHPKAPAANHHHVKRKNSQLLNQLKVCKNNLDYIFHFIFYTSLYFMFVENKITVVKIPMLLFMRGFIL